MTYIATESIEWCIARCERETNPFSQIAEAQLAALKTQNEGLRGATNGLLKLALLVGYVENGRYNIRGGCLIHQDQIQECSKAIKAAQITLGQEEDKTARLGFPDFEFLLKASKDLYDLAMRRLPGCSLPGCLVCAENKEILKTAAKAIHQAEEVRHEQT